MNALPLNLSSTIIRLEYQKKKVLDSTKTKNAMCWCRKKLLENYTSIVQLLLMKLVNSTYEFYEGDETDIEDKVLHIKEWFLKTAYDSLYENNRISNRMVLFFKLLQTPLDDKIFSDYIAKHKVLSDINRNIDCRETIKSSYEEFAAEIAAEISEYFDIFIMNVMSVQVDCKNVCSNILVNHGVPHQESCKGNYKECTLCKYSSCDPACSYHEKFVNNEKLHYIVTEEQLDTPGWIENYLGLFENYHINIKNVTLIIDYQLFTAAHPYKHSDDSFKFILRASNLFKKTRIINHEFVDFGKFTTNLAPMIES